jgi:ribonuclease HII
MPYELLGRRDRQLLRGAARIVGIDEVGRGALAGPVVVAGVAFERIPVNVEVQDSKALTRRRREAAARWIRSHCAEWAVVEVGVELVDRLNILEATRGAMRAVARVLATPETVVVVDAVELRLEGLRALAPCHADAHYFAVAAASILAKLHRDALLSALALRHPDWGWERNVGYPTADHRRALAIHGQSFLHRRSFRCSSPA